VALAAMGFRTLSMRPASIGPVKSLIRRVDLLEARRVIDDSRLRGDETVRPALTEWLAKQP
jgi:phosphotransferase system enzyme I (PtsP)